jgi:hypothetical protein
MSNRIDLTQFEEMEDNRPWSASWYPAEEEVEPDFLIDGGAEGHKVRTVNTQGGITLAYIANGNEVLAKQIAKLPDLIAELKRCYEKFDNLKRLVTWNHTDSDNIANDDGLLVVLTELLTSE